QYFVRSPSERAWRFDNHPFHSYQVTRTQTGIIAVTKLFTREGTSTGDLVEVTPSSDLSATRAVYLEASQRLFQAGASEVMTWMLPHRPEKKILEGVGFQLREQHRSLSVKVLDPSRPELGDPLIW